MPLRSWLPSLHVLCLRMPNIALISSWRAVMNGGLFSVKPKSKNKLWSHCSHMTIFRKRGHWAPSALLCSLWRKLLQLGAGGMTSRWQSLKQGQRVTEGGQPLSHWIECANQISQLCRIYPWTAGAGSSATHVSCSATGTVTQCVLRYPLWSSSSEPEGNFPCLRLLLATMSIFAHCDLHRLLFWMLKPERDYYFYSLLFDSAKAHMQSAFPSDLLAQ